MNAPALPPIQHRPPFLFVGEVIAQAPRSFSAWADFAHDNPYVGAEHVPRSLIVEALAQTVALAAAAEAGGTPQPGVLAMVRHFSFYRDIQPGARVRLRVSLQRHLGQLWAYHCDAEIDENQSKICEGELVVARHKSP